MKFPERVIVKYCLVEERKVLFYIVIAMLNKVVLNIVDQCLQNKLVGSDKDIQESRDAVFRQGNFTTINTAFRNFVVNVS